MKSSLIEEAQVFLQKWRIASSEMLRLKGLSRTLTNRQFKDLLHRLRENGFLFTLRLSNERFHFDYRLQKRWAALHKLSNSEREKKWFSWGLDHHLKVAEIGLQLEKIFPSLSLVANLFSDHVSFSLGTKGSGRKKFVPDLVLTGATQASQEFAYVEVERTLKEKSRYQERWIAYENDPDLKCCLYWVYDASFGKRLERWMGRYFSDSYTNPNFKLAVLYNDDFEKNPNGKIVSAFDIEGRRTETLSKGLFNRDFLESMSSRPPFFSLSQKLNHFDAFHLDAELTPLPLPEHSTNNLKVADATVRGVSSASKWNEYLLDEVKKTEVGTKEENQARPPPLNLF